MAFQSLLLEGIADLHFPGFVMDAQYVESSLRKQRTGKRAEPGPSGVNSRVGKLEAGQRSQLSDKGEAQAGQRGQLPASKPNLKLVGERSASKLVSGVSSALAAAPDVVSEVNSRRQAEAGQRGQLPRPAA
ncbi:hypothetical protein CYMTET_33726 [Cymbomonas tetramitiformis]|uniref:Uncharacterized protein n=1 Tax=Cymbomonas tetramitiformis TaxID=36881 RepID=A0AAE0KQN4_9CHLO|nr:hypothetical protein CYMTET_33726 [Cymbomonas tetramitiformis]